MFQMVIYLLNIEVLLIEFYKSKSKNKKFY